MNELNYIFSGNIWVLVFTIGIAISIITRIIKKYFSIIATPKYGEQKVSRFLSLLEAFIWAVFLAYSIDIVWHKNIFGGLFLLIFAGLLLLVWIYFYFRDYLSGLIIKTERNLTPGDFLKFGEISGRVISLKGRTLILEKENGEEIIIPYHKLTNNTFSIKKANREKTFSYGFEIDVEASTDPKLLQEKIKKYLLMLPWVKPDPLPIINIQYIEKEPSPIYKVSITIAPVASQFIYDIETSIKNQFEIKKENNDK